MAGGGTGLLELPLGVKIPVLPGSKPVFCRTKLGEKVKGEERGRKGCGALLRESPSFSSCLVGVFGKAGAALLGEGTQCPPSAPACGALFPGQRLPGGRVS